jgi:hypothetical protein
VTIHTISQSLDPDLVVALGLVSVKRPEGVSTSAKVAWDVVFWVRTTSCTHDKRQPVFVKIGFVV